MRRLKDPARRPKIRLLPPTKMIFRPRMRAAAARIRWSMRMVQLFDSVRGPIKLMPRSSGARRPSNARATARFTDAGLGLEVEIEKLRLWLPVAEQEDLS